MPISMRYVVHAGFWMLVGYALAPRIASVPIVNKIPQI